MRHVDGVYTQRLNRAAGRDGPLFRGRFKSILVQRETYFLALVRYIHLNGVAAGLVLRAGEQRFCSHAAYLAPARRPGWLTVADVLERFGGDTAEARRRMDDFVHAPVGGALQARLDGAPWPAALGGKGFMEAVRNGLATAAPHPQKPQDRALRRTIRPEEVLRVVETAFGVEPGPAWRAAGRRRNDARRVAMHVLRRVCLLTHAEIGSLLGGVGYGTVAQFLRQPLPPSREVREIAEKVGMPLDRLKTQT
jgi:hypothetical protein